MFGSDKIPLLEDEITQFRQQLQNQGARARGLLRHARTNLDRLDEFFAPSLAKSAQNALKIIDKSTPDRYASWSSSSWEAWSAPIWSVDDSASIELPSRIRVGELLEQRQNGAKQFSVPGFAPFIGEHKTIIVMTKGDKHDAGLGLLQSLVIRIAFMLPHQTTYTLLDPAGNGAAFPMRRHLVHVRENSGDVRRDLEQVIQDIQRINETYLDASSPSLELVDPQLRINERFQFVFAADFPNKYDRRSIEALQSVANTGPRTGTYVFIHYNADTDLPRDISIEEFNNAAFIDLNEQISLSNCNLNFMPDPAPEPKWQEVHFEKLRDAKPPERKVGWESVTPAADWWSEVATDLIATPIGVSGASGTLSIWFGVNQEGFPCAHGMLGAMTGSGKSNLYHVLILGLCVRYSPSELRLFLIDGKDGVEFHPYRDLPYAEVVSLKSSPQLSRSVLAELVDERERRNRIFADMSVTDLAQYRKTGEPQGKLPRILLLVDEYQELFEGDRDGVASQLLLQLAQQGRSAGIHMLLGSQRFGAPGMLNQSAIFGNIHLRMAMQMTSSDIQALSEFGRRGKQLIARCDLPGKIVVNDHSGDDSSNVEGKVAFLTNDQRQQIIEKLIAKARDTLPSKDVPVTIVFDGKAQPNLIENPHISYLLQQDDWLTPQGYEELARRPVYDEGFGVVDWFAAESPDMVWVGQDFSVRGEATIVVRRRTAEHIMLIGAANAARFGMLAAILVNLALNNRANEAEFIVIDRSIPGTSWHQTLPSVIEHVLMPTGYATSLVRDNKEVELVLDKLNEEIDRRRNLNEADLIHEPSLYAMMCDLDRVDDLRRRADTYGTSETAMGQKMNRVCVEGSSLGIHLILSFSGVRPMAHVVDERRGLLNFRHRVALQMSEDESLTFVRSRRASQLQIEGPTPVCALYLDVENDNNLRFKPYSIESTIDFESQLQAIGQHLVEWSKYNEYG